MTVEWIDPPPRMGRQRGVWATELAPLKERPMQWARVRRSVSGGARSSILTSLACGGEDPSLYEIRNVHAEPGSSLCDVYVRYVGEPE